MPPKAAIITVEVPEVPDVILSTKARDRLYLANWLVGSALAATVAGWLATGLASPIWLLVAVTVYSSVSGSVSLIAKANLAKRAK